MLFDISLAAFLKTMFFLYIFFKVAKVLASDVKECIASLLAAVQEQ